MQTSQSTGFAWSRTSLSFVIRHHFFLFHSIRDGRVVKPAMPVLFAFMGPVGLLAWRWVCVSLHCENRRFRNGQRKQIIRTHLLLETSSDYIGLVREAGVEPARPCEHWHLKPASLPIPPLAQVVLRRSAQEIYYHRMSPVSTLFSLFFCVREKKLS